MASSDSFVIYIRSSRDFNFAVLASDDDDISSLKKKAEAQHLALFPQNGKIVAQTIKIMQEGEVYSLPSNIPVRCLFDVDGDNKGIRLLFMDEAVVPPDSARTHIPVLDLCQNGDPSNQKKSKKGEGNPSSSSDDDEVPPSSASMERKESPKTGGDRMQERSGSAAPENENETAGTHLVIWNPGENFSLAPSGSDLRDNGTVTPDNQIKNIHHISAPETSIAESVKKKRRTRERENVRSTPTIRERANESEIREEDASKKKKRKQDETQQLEHTLSEKEKFVSKDDLRAAVNEFHKHKKIEVKWTQNNLKFVVVQCKNSRCKWRLYAKVRGVGHQSRWVIQKCHTPHTCQ